MKTEVLMQQRNVQVILIGNYPKDRQESMERFAQMLNYGLKDFGIETEIWRPREYIGRFFKSTTSGLGKWFGYVDKWILFPLVLKFRILKESHRIDSICFHICDHSNAPYLKHLPAHRVGITCHDVLAIRGAFGYADAYCSASMFGIFLQKWILKNLLSVRKLASVSQFSLNQLNELAGNNQVNSKEWRVIHNGFNADFKPMNITNVNNRLLETGLDPEIPFILHVGSALERKNRKLLLDMVAVLGEKWKGFIYYAGKAVDDTLLRHAQMLGLQNRVVSIPKPSHATLMALYNACDAFIFPSLSEGFGWPVIEAQACGAPVIASKYQPMPEVSGGAAIHADPTDPDDFAMAFLSLQNKDTKIKLIQKGFENAKRFQTSFMIQNYLQLYGITPAKF